MVVTCRLNGYSMSMTSNSELTVLIPLLVTHDDPDTRCIHCWSRWYSIHSFLTDDGIDDCILMLLMSIVGLSSLVFLQSQWRLILCSLLVPFILDILSIPCCSFLHFIVTLPVCDRDYSIILLFITVTWWWYSILLLCLSLFWPYTTSWHYIKFLIWKHHCVWKCVCYYSFCILLSCWYIHSVIAIVDVNFVYSHSVFCSLHSHCSSYSTLILLLCWWYSDAGLWWKCVMICDVMIPVVVHYCWYLFYSYHCCSIVDGSVVVAVLFDTIAGDDVHYLHHSVTVTHCGKNTLHSLEMEHLLSWEWKEHSRYPCIGEFPVIPAHLMWCLHLTLQEWCH